MWLNGTKHNFGRVIYLTIFRDVSNSALQSTDWAQQTLEKTDNITLCFDPKRDVNLNTRIDFYVKHMGDAGVGNNGFFTTANIDVYNIGPAIQQFLDAYNAYKSEGHFAGVNTKKYAVVLQVGYAGEEKRTTIFAGRISSFVMERRQNDNSVDNVWHFFCQYPTSEENGQLGTEKAYSGQNYATEYGDTFNPNQTYTSWENLLKSAICARRREIFALQGTTENVYKYSFEADVESETESGQNSTPLVVKPETVTVNLQDFSKYYKIEYRVSKRSTELKTVKEYWQQQVPVNGWQINSSNVQKLATNIARAVNCHARVELNEQTGIQTIYIYPAGWAEQIPYRGDADYIIVDYQNLRKPPQVSANMLQLDMMLQPSMRPGDTIELRITADFQKAHPHSTFEANYSMANATTVFAGANFIGLTDMSEEEKRKNAIASAGNIFNTQFIATIVEFRGSSHTAEWSTKADCYGVVIGGKETTL